MANKDKGEKKAKRAASHSLKEKRAIKKAKKGSRGGGETGSSSFQITGGGGN